MSEEKRYSVLVVDDQEQILKTIEIMLRNSPFIPVCVSTGEQAQRAAEEQSFDIMLLDIMMPDVSGIALCVRLRRNPRQRDVPVVILTAANDPMVHKRAKTAGADAILLKPIGKKPLIQQLLNLVGKTANTNETPMLAR